MDFSLNYGYTKHISCKNKNKNNKNKIKKNYLESRLLKVVNSFIQGRFMNKTHNLKTNFENQSLYYITYTFRSL